MKTVWEFIVKNKKVILIILTILIFLFIGLPAIKKINGKRRLETFDKGVYGIALVTEYRAETRSTHYRYEFEYKDEIYSSRYYYANYNPEVGKRYFVLIDPDHPWFNNMLLPIFPVPDSIKEAPPEGWKECPGVSRKQIREFLDHY